MLEINTIINFNPNESINNMGIFKRPVTEANPVIIIIWIKFGSFLNKYLHTIKIKPTPISPENKLETNVLSNPSNVASELNATSKSEIRIFNSSRDPSGSPLANKDKLLLNKLIKSSNRVNIAT